MRTGVKYCGGCNPHYDREKEVALLNQKLAEKKSEIVPLKDEIEYDKILLVCGCPRVCLKKYLNQEPEKYILLQRRRDFDNLENRLINKKRN